MRTRTRIGVAAVVFALIAAGSIIASMSLFDGAKAQRIALENSNQVRVDSIYADRIESRFDPGYDRAPYREIAAGFAADPVYVDDYQAWAVTDGELAAIRAEVAGLTDPIVVAFLTLSQLDATDGDADLAAARIARELPSPTGTVLVVGNTQVGLGEKGVERKWTVDRPGRNANASSSSQALLWVRALAAADAREPYSEPDYIDTSGQTSARELSYSPGSAVGGVVFGALAGVGSSWVAVISLRWYRRQSAAGNGADEPAAGRAPAERQRR